MTDKPYVPTMFDMRGAYFEYRSEFGFFDPAIYAEFEEWLDQVRAEAKAEALRDFADAHRGAVHHVSRRQLCGHSKRPPARPSEKIPRRTRRIQQGETMSEHKPTYEDMEIAYGLDKHFRWWLQARESRIEAAAEQRGAIKALRDAAESDDLIDHMLANLRANQPIAVREASRYLHNRADLLEGDDADA